MCKLTWHTGLSKQPWNPSGVIGHMQDVCTSAVYLIWPSKKSATDHVGLIAHPHLLALRAMLKCCPC